MKRHNIVRSIFLFALFTACFLLANPVSAAATIVVDTTADLVADDGFCSLREAIIAANSDAAYNNCLAGSGSDTIVFDPTLPTPATFVLSIAGTGEEGAMTGDLDLTGTLMISGNGNDNTIIDGNTIDRVLHIQPAANITVSGLTIRNGNPGAMANGGGIAVEQTGRLTLNSSTVTGNTAGFGGGVYSFGGLTLNDSVVKANQAGGLHNSTGFLILNNVQIINNLLSYGIINEQGGYLQHTGGEVSGNNGGGIKNDDSTAELSNLTIDGNTVGGGVHNRGVVGTAALTIINSSINNNASASGGGLLNEGFLASATVENARISFNNATAVGGGVSNNGNLTLKNSTIDHNQARTGGGIGHQGTTFQAQNVTISSNTASDNGGGLNNETSASLTHVTLSGNDSDTGGNIYNDGDAPQISFTNSIVANPISGGNCVNPTGNLNSLGHNLESTDTCDFNASGDLVNSDPLLGPLQDNGGPAPTHALLPSSPAIDQADNASCPAVDQRGAIRPFGVECDSGAYEIDAIAVTQNISLGSEWNSISIHVYPFEPAVASILAAVQADMVLIKNDAGEIYWPALFIDQIGEWQAGEGYQIYMTSPVTLSVTGYQINPALRPLVQEPGWNLAAYLRDSATPIEIALDSISSELILAKNGAGQVYWPAYSVNQIGNMEPGQGYQLYMNSAAILIYPDN